MNRIVRGTLAAMLMSGLAPAMADATPTAQLSNFGLTLVDLDPGDGIAPWVDLTRFDGSHAFVFGGAGSFASDGSSIFGPVAAASVGGGSNATSAIDGDLLAGGAAHADASTLNSFAQAFVDAGTFGTKPTFTLSPRTELMLMGTADVSAAIGPGPREGQAEGAVELAISGPPPAFVFDHDYRSAIALDGGAREASSQGDLAVSFSNLGDSPVDGTFYVYVWAAASNVPPVPEPANLVLVLCALGGGWLVVRRGARESANRANA